MYFSGNPLLQFPATMPSCSTACFYPITFTPRPQPSSHLSNSSVGSFVSPAATFNLFRNTRTANSARMSQKPILHSIRHILGDELANSFSPPTNSAHGPTPKISRKRKSSSDKPAPKRTRSPKILKTPEAVECVRNDIEVAKISSPIGIPPLSPGILTEAPERMMEAEVLKTPEPVDCSRNKTETPSGIPTEAPILKTPEAVECSRNYVEVAKRSSPIEIPPVSPEALAEASTPPRILLGKHNNIRIILKLMR